MNFSTDDDNYYFVKNALLDSNNNFYVFGYKAPDGYHRTMILLKYKHDPITGIEEEPEELSKEFALYQNYPNPFNPTTKIKYQVAEAGVGTLKIYDVLGREVETLVNGELFPGDGEVTFDASGLPSGIYFYRLTSGDFSSTKKMLLLR